MVSRAKRTDYGLVSCQFCKTLIGAALFLIPAQIYDIKYYVEHNHYHIERLDYMMCHGVYDKKAAALINDQSFDGVQAGRSD